MGFLSSFYSVSCVAPLVSSRIRIMSSIAMRIRTPPDQGESDLIAFTVPILLNSFYQLIALVAALVDSSPAWCSAEQSTDSESMFLTVKHLDRKE